MSRSRRITLKDVHDASRCRRRRERTALTPSAIKGWKESTTPSKVAAIEFDTRGARLLFPWNVESGEEVQVAVADDLGFYQTRTARVVWTRALESTSKTIAGIVFDSELAAA